MPSSPEFKAFQKAHIVDTDPESGPVVTECHVVTLGRLYVTVQTIKKETRRFRNSDVYQKDRPEAGLLEDVARGERGILVTTRAMAEAVSERVRLERELRLALTGLDPARLSVEQMRQMRGIIEDA